MRLIQTLFMMVLAILMTACGGGGSSSASPPISAPTPLVSPLAFAATSYENAKSVAPVTLPVIEGGIDAFAVADFARNGTKQLFTAELLYNPATSTPSTATKSVFKFWAQSGGAWIEQSAMIDTNVGCIHPRKAMVADVNGDGKADIIVACHGYDAAPFPGEKMMAVLSTSTGQYHVTTVGNYQGFFHSASLGDINGDGNIDIVAVDNTNRSGTIRVFMGSGDGTFVERPALAPGNNANTALFTLELVDINGDGLLDLLVGGHDDSNGLITTISGTGTTGFASGNVRQYGAVLNYSVALDFLVGANTLYVGRTTTSYTGSAVEALDLTSGASSLITSNPTARWTPAIVRYNGNVTSAIVGRGV